MRYICRLNKVFFFLIECMHEFNNWGRKKKANAPEALLFAVTSCVCLQLKFVLLLLFATCKDHWGIVFVVC